MHCVVTGGPTYEALDRVRGLTNISSGRLGIKLAAHLAGRGHHVVLLLGERATWDKASFTGPTERFGDGRDLSERLRKLRAQKVEAVFHTAAVSDFTFGKIWAQAADGSLTELREGKVSSRSGTLLAELVPTSKIIAELRDWFPAARLVGWKYEVDGDRWTAISAGQAQLAACRTDACVVNGPAYGAGFGLVVSGRPCEHLAGREELCAALEGFLRT